MPVPDNVEGALDNALKNVEQAQNAATLEQPIKTDEKLLQAQQELANAKAELEKAVKKGEIAAASESSIAHLIESLAELKMMLSKAETPAEITVVKERLNKWIPKSWQK